MAYLGNQPLQGVLTGDNILNGTISAADLDTSLANLINNKLDTGTLATSVSTGTLTYTGTLTGGTGVVNLGSGQFVKDAAGNLGLGVTPNAWASGRKALQVSAGTGGAFLVSSSAQQATLGMNAYSDGATYRYATTGTSSLYDQGGGVHSWYTAPSGTAGNPISFTQAMTLDANRVLTIGATTAGGALNLYSPGAILTITPDASSGANGVSYDTSFAAGGAGPHIWKVGGSTKMTLDASGNLLVGVTSADVGKVYVRRDSTALPVLQLHNEAASGQMVTYRTNGNSQVGSITFTAAGVSYNTSSDYRLKNITGAVTNSGAYIDSLNPVEGTWKADGSTFVGLIAHEVQEASRTQVATGVKDGKEMQAMDYSSSELIANMIAELKSLRARVAQLESN